MLAAPNKPSLRDWRALRLSVRLRNVSSGRAIARTRREESMLHNTGKKHDRIVLWAMPISAWSGKIRSYLVKKGVEFEERFPGDGRYNTDILPGIGYFVVPVVEMPDGTVMQ